MEKRLNHARIAYLFEQPSHFHTSLFFEKGEAHHIIAGRPYFGQMSKLVVRGEKASTSRVAHL
jgi:hypothetical protein